MPTCCFVLLQQLPKCSFVRNFGLKTTTEIINVKKLLSTWNKQSEMFTSQFAVSFFSSFFPEIFPLELCHVSILKSNEESWRKTGSKQLNLSVSQTLGVPKICVQFWEWQRQEILSQNHMLVSDLSNIDEFPFNREHTTEHGWVRPPSLFTHNTTDSVKSYNLPPPPNNSFAMSAIPKNCQKVFCNLHLN